MPRNGRHAAAAGAASVGRRVGALVVPSRPSGGAPRTCHECVTTSAPFGSRRSGGGVEGSGGQWRGEGGGQWRNGLEHTSPMSHVRRPVSHRCLHPHHHPQVRRRLAPCSNRRNASSRPGQPAARSLALSPPAAASIPRPPPHVASRSLALSRSRARSRSLALSCALLRSRALARSRALSRALARSRGWLSWHRARVLLSLPLSLSPSLSLSLTPVTLCRVRLAAPRQAVVELSPLPPPQPARAVRADLVRRVRQRDLARPLALPALRRLRRVLHLRGARQRRRRPGGRDDLVRLAVPPPRADAVPRHVREL